MVQVSNKSEMEKVPVSAKRRKLGKGDYPVGNADDRVGGASGRAPQNEPPQGKSATTWHKRGRPNRVPMSSMEGKVRGM
jgi:hypothetical protein